VFVNIYKNIPPKREETNIGKGGGRGRADKRRKVNVYPSGVRFSKKRGRGGLLKKRKRRRGACRPRGKSLRGIRLEWGARD